MHARVVLGSSGGSSSGETEVNVDVAIIGAGPVGLCLAHALSDKGLSVLIVERQAREALADPAFDGREIALSHPSQRILESMGIWQRFDPAEVSLLKDALVLDGPVPKSMSIHAGDAGHDRLGHLVPNHLIRRHAWEAVVDSNVQFRDSTNVDSIRQKQDCVELTLNNGESVSAKLLVAADSRFSETRRQLGISAHMHDFGKAMMVCRFQHEIPHHHTALEWFGYGQTMALLPLNDNCVSVVLTLPQEEHKVLMDMDDAVFAEHIRDRMQNRLGRLTVASTRHVYPLVGVYASRFHGHRFTLAGDAAVGMHPVTAHGFNFGIQSVERLAKVVCAAHASGQDIGASAVLEAYGKAHRKATLPLYMATFAVANIFTNDHRPMRMLRRALLTVAERATPFKRIVIGHLTQAK